jgi:hypothetical protein
MWSCNHDWLNRFFAIKDELLLRDFALLADNTRLIRAAVAARLAGSHATPAACVPAPCRSPRFSVVPMRRSARQPQTASTSVDPGSGLSPRAAPSF